MLCKHTHVGHYGTYGVLDCLLYCAFSKEFPCGVLLFLLKFPCGVHCSIVASTPQSMAYTYTMRHNSMIYNFYYVGLHKHQNIPHNLYVSMRGFPSLIVCTQPHTPIFNHPGFARLPGQQETLILLSHHNARPLIHQRARCIIVGTLHIPVSMFGQVTVLETLGNGERDVCPPSNNHLHMVIDRSGPRIV